MTDCRITDRNRRSARRLLASWAMPAALALGLLQAPSTGFAQEAACTNPLARVVSVQGTADVKRGSTDWTPAALDAVLCAGDAIRVGARSRAALLLRNETTLRLDQGTTLTLSPPDARGTTLIDQLSGGLHVITRTPRPFRVKTPFVNANVEGTEFAVRVTPRDATVSVDEGQVVASNDFGAVSVESGERAIAVSGTAPRKDVVIRSPDSVAWTLHFPSVFDPGSMAADPGTSPEIRQSLDAYRDNRLSDALRLAPPGQDGATASAYRAGLLLSVGRVDEARPLLDASVRGGTTAADALAMLSVIALAENDRAQALALAERSVELAPTRATPFIALSYALQGLFRIEQAHTAALRAVDAEPGNALAWARVSEIRMALGNLEGARAAAAEAIALDPRQARTQTVLGFASLVSLDLDAAGASFRSAIALDQGDPLPRLGLGLTLVRRGDLPAGRAELEIAAALDTGNSLVRSYLGKAYYEERRDSLAATQFQLAEARDPNDPTPYFYDAIRRLAANMPVEALRDLSRSIELNDNRAVYRSRFLLDDDRAARTTSLSAIYAELGFERLSIAEGVKALATTAGNDAAHRQLAAAYANLPRHDVARVSEALQAQIRQPVTLAPIDPQLSTDNLGILRGTGPARLGANEFNLLFARDQIRYQADAVAGSRGTWGDQAVVSGLSGPVAWSGSQLHYQTDGFRDNDSARKNAYDLFVQGQISPRVSLQAELRHSNVSLGETFFPFDPLVVSPERIKERSDVVRFSGHYDDNAASDWIFSLASENRNRRAELSPEPIEITETQSRLWSLSAQHLRRFGPVQLTLGFENLRERDYSPLEMAEVTEIGQSAYVYGQWQPDRTSIAVTVGLSAEHFRLENPFFTNRIERHRVSPKLGIVWTPTPNTTVRAAAFSSVKRPLVASWTLEPTQLAGFNQFFTGFESFYGDPDGTVSKRAGIGVDQRLGRDRYAGLEVSARDLDVPSLIAAQDFRWKERNVHAYLYDARIVESTAATARRWTIASSIEYELERLERPQILSGPEGVVSVTTQRVPFGVRAFNGPYTMRLGETYIRQTGDFSADVSLDTFTRRTSGWISDLSVDYRIPRRAGTVSVGVRNVFDKRLDLFQSDPFAPRDALGRFVYARVRVVF